MIERDPRWEKVTARVAPSENWAGRVEFRIEVRGGGQVVGQTFLADPRELAVPGAYGHILNRMVHKLDEAIHA